VPGTCGKGAKCKVVNGKADCECLPGHQGNPFSECAIRKFLFFFQIFILVNFSFFLN
jgi:hypothetical protein